MPHGIVCKYSQYSKTFLVQDSNGLELSGPKLGGSSTILPTTVTIQEGQDYLNKPRCIVNLSFVIEFVNLMGLRICHANHSHFTQQNDSQST